MIRPNGGGDPYIVFEYGACLKRRRGPPARDATHAAAVVSRCRLEESRRRARASRRAERSVLATSRSATRCMTRGRRHRPARRSAAHIAPTRVPTRPPHPLHRPRLCAASQGRRRWAHGRAAGGQDARDGHQGRLDAAVAPPERRAPVAENRRRVGGGALARRGASEWRLDAVPPAASRLSVADRMEMESGFAVRARAIPCRAGRPAIG